MAQVWVQVWSAQVPGAVAVEEALLREVVDFQKMVPMLVRVEEKVEVLEPLQLVQEMAEDLEKAQQARAKALSQGWGWVLREKEKE
jgi:predicted DNA-binding transcriptional regulator YafY